MNIAQPTNSNLGKSIALSIAMLVSALVLLWLGYALRPATGPTLDLTEIMVEVPLSPPPPPPPPTVKQSVKVPILPPKAQGAGPPLKMMTSDRQQFDITMPEAPMITTSNIDWQPLEVNWNALGLSELDTMPTLLSPLKARIPRSLSRRGINSVMVELEILIDLKGRVTLIEIKRNPYQELEVEIKRLIRMARFSTPMKNGAPVRARFILPMEITN